ncbi:insulinase family protein [Shewanella sp. JM162201]|uniref:Insulinase family protein n=1 Tax=Shewanella jiangmenensis TaxID=2837387 RepID=A0ABS5V0N8_9GAMM|nr:pitrilysin family protein [Shewanella jiangmenensis]MBT1443357.1 insulinase family protein [Shewanella jiangmenensis]
MKKWILAVAISAALAGCASKPDNGLPDGVELIESVQVEAGAVGIPYNKYRLANGLTVVLHQDKSDPLVHVDVTYHVGSGRELPGRSGFAHLFEHMMFQGSQNVADEQHFKVVTESGGTLNGTTNTDRTNYFETVPSNQLEKMLWLESDRMGFFLPALTSEKFEVQRETVKNERAQRIDNQPYGRMYERFNQAMYPAGHPYSWPVIGWPEDLNRAKLEDVKAFFQRWYGPNNATLTIGGDFDELQTLAWVNKYFGEIPRGPEVEALPKSPVKLDKDRYLSMEDKVHLPLIRMALPTVYASHEDEAALDLLANILGGGQTSLMYKNLVKEGYAVQANVSHPCRELSCELSFVALANPAKGGSLKDTEQRIRASIAEFERRGVTDADLEKVKVQFEANTIFGLESVRGKVSTLAANETFYGDPNKIASDLQRYASVTKADVQRVFNKYVKGKPMVVMSVVPEGARSLIAAKDNYKAPAPLVAKEAVAGEIEVEEAESSFDRSIMPASGNAPTLNVPTLWRDTLGNGIAVLGTQNLETPTTEIVIYLAGGHRLADVRRAGVASLTAAMLNESSQRRTSEELAQALELLGATVEFSASEYQSEIKVSALTEKLDQTLAVLKEKLQTPGFKKEDFARVKQQALQVLKHSQSNPDYLAETGFARLLYGKDNALGVDVSGTIESVSALTLQDIKAFYTAQYRAGNAQIVAVSSAPQSKLIKSLSALNSWKGIASPIPELGKLPVLEGGTIYVLDKPGAAQSVISIGKLAMPFDATGEYFKAGLMNYPLGGAFNSRINLNLREDKGYTYGARSRFRGGLETGQFVASASVRSDVTAKAVTEFLKEISGYRDGGIRADELEFMRSSISQGQALDYETPYQKAGFMRMIQRYKLSDDFTAEQDKIVSHIQKSQIDALARKHLNIHEMVILVVGDKASISQELKALGYPVKDLAL